jgi:hypothetical protein
MADQDYDTDLTLWAESQARALRDAGHAGTDLPIDWANVAAEIEALGKSQARELASRIRTILVHQIKLQASPATEPRGGWRAAIQEQRSGIEAVPAWASGSCRRVADNSSSRPSARLLLHGKSIGTARRKDPRNTPARLMPPWRCRRCASRLLWFRP